MTPEQVEKFKTAITSAVEDHLASGGTLCSGSFGGEENGGCCPISCLLGTSVTWESRDYMIAKKLNITFSPNEMWEFIAAFDGIKTVGVSLLTQFGRELREKYLPDPTP